MMIPVLFRLDDDGEAYDVIYFCSQACRGLHKSDDDEVLEPGLSSDWIDGTQCEQCGEEVVGHLAIDHIDGNPFNNDRENLRIVNIRENSR